MAEKLTKQQAMAVTDRGGDLLVSAAAGSGKTKVLVERLMVCITDDDDPANIDDFLIITYTKAAATELRSKIAKALTQRIAEDPGNYHLQQQFQRLYLAKISTVHSFCTDVLREFSYMLDIPGDFRMMEEQEEYPLRRDVLDRVLANAYDSIETNTDLVAFVDSQGIGRNDLMLPDLILKVYDSAKCHMDSEGWLTKCLSDCDTSEITDAGETVWGQYLIESLFDSVDQNLVAIKNAAQSCDSAVGLEKMAAILYDIYHQLLHLRNSKCWDDIHQRIDLDFGNLRGASSKKNADKEVYAAAKVVRDFCMKDMKNILEDFGNSSESVLADLKAVYPAARGLVSLVRSFSKQYQQVKKALRVMDFSDLEHHALDLLVGKRRSGPSLIARQIGARFRQILVDEYQDSNEVQDAIFTALTKDHNNLFMVGDVKQSIYQFRLADPSIFLEKYSRFVPAEKAEVGQGRKIVLSNNFRSGPEIIEAVNSVFRSSMSPKVGGLCYGDEEALWEGVPRKKLPETAVSLHLIDVDSETYIEEAEYVASEISSLLDGTHYIRDGEDLRPVQAEDIAILLRSPKTSGEYFRNALLERGIRSSSSNNFNLLLTEEVEWLRSLLQAINNPRQDISLIAAITGPVFDFTANDLAAIRASMPKACFYDALKASDLPKATEFILQLHSLRRAARLLTLPQLIETILLNTRADAIYSAMRDGEIRSANLRDFYHFAVRFSSNPGNDLSQFLRYLQQCDETGITASRQSQNVGCVQIISIHKSKGLEYPVVFLCGLSRAFNMRSTTGSLLCDAKLGLGLSCVDHKKRIRYPSIANSAISRKLHNDSISEELRVLYVAMTRPRDRLYMTFAHTKLRELLSALSAQIDMCPRELLNSRVSCLGTWVLYTALQRTEAGALFSIARKPEFTVVSEIPWDIRYSEAKPIDLIDSYADEAPILKFDKKLEHDLKESIDFHYPHTAATSVPSKQTATQIKGRIKDQEAQEDAPQPSKYSGRWKAPDFSKHHTTGQDFGNATHAVLQHLDLKNCESEAAIAQQICALSQSGRITEDQAKMIDYKKIAHFFDSEIGQRLQCSSNVLREFKFSIMEDANVFYPHVTAEKVLIQGVVDCAIIDSDGITVLDFKTDHVTAETLLEITNDYRRQVDLYANALSRIFEQPVKEKILYFFSIDTMVIL